MAEERKKRDKGLQGERGGERGAKQLAHACHADRESIAEFLAPPLIGSADAALLKSSFFPQGGFHQTTASLEHPLCYSCEVVANKQS